MPDQSLRIESGTALVPVDVQNDFLTDGALAAPEGDTIIPPLNGERALQERATPLTRESLV